MMFPRTDSKELSTGDRRAQTKRETLQTTKLRCHSVRPACPNAPDQLDVICGRGKPTHCHPGNQFLNALIQSYLAGYTKAPSKKGKSMIVSNIINRIHSRGGHFVKFCSRQPDNKNGEEGTEDHSGNDEANSEDSFPTPRTSSTTSSWERVSLRVAREKVGQLMRDASTVHAYRSSASAKRQRRVRLQHEQNDATTVFVQQNKTIRTILGRVERVVEANERKAAPNKILTDDEMGAVFDEANKRILKELKRCAAEAETADGHNHEEVAIAIGKKREADETVESHAQAQEQRPLE